MHKSSNIKINSRNPLGGTSPKQISIAIKTGRKSVDSGVYRLISIIGS